MTKKNKTPELREKTLKQLQNARAQLQKEHPETFAALQKLALMVAEKQPDKAAPRVETKKSKQPPKQETQAVDRKKNLEIILKYAASNPGVDLGELKEEIKRFLH